MPDPNAPISFGRYVLLRRISASIATELYAAARAGADTPQFVVRRLLPRFAREADLSTVFVEECKLAHRLSHPNLVRCLQVGSESGTPYCALEYVDGLDARTLIESNGGKLDPILAARIGAQVCAALSCVHRAASDYGEPLKLLHRDVLAKKVLVTRAGVAKLAPIQLSKTMAWLRKANPGVVRSAYHHVSPEQVERKALDSRADLFSLGGLLYEMLTGQRPFERKTPAETLQAISFSAPSSPSDLQPSVPPALSQIVMRALEKDRERRYQQALELQLDLEAWLSAAGAAPSPEEGVERTSAIQQNELAPLLTATAAPHGPGAPLRRGVAPAPEDDPFSPPSVPRSAPATFEPPAAAPQADAFSPPAAPTPAAKPAAPVAAAAAKPPPVSPQTPPPRAKASPLTPPPAKPSPPAPTPPPLAKPLQAQPTIPVEKPLPPSAPPPLGAGGAAATPYLPPPSSDDVVPTELERKVSLPPELSEDADDLVPTPIQDMPVEALMAAAAQEAPGAPPVATAAVADLASAAMGPVREMSAPPVAAPLPELPLDAAQMVEPSNPQMAAVQDSDVQELEGQPEPGYDGSQEQGYDASQEQEGDGAQDQGFDGSPEHGFDGSQEQAFEGAEQPGLEPFQDPAAVERQTLSLRRKKRHKRNKLKKQLVLVAGYLALLLGASLMGAVAYRLTRPSTPPAASAPP